MVSTIMEMVLEPVGARLLERAASPLGLPFDAFQDRLLGIAESVVNSPSLTRLCTALDKAVLDYEPIRYVLSQVILAALGGSRYQSSAQIVAALAQELYDSLDSMAIQFSQQDKKAILSILVMQARLFQVLDALPQEHAEAFNLALVDSFWALRKIDLCLTVLYLIDAHNLKVGHPKVAHWLCVAMAGYERQVESAFFANDPILRTRMQHRGQLLTNEEMERRVGLRD